MKNPLLRWLPLLLGVALMLAITGCSDDDDTPTPPTVQSVTPANDAVDVDLDTSIEISFSMAMNQASVEAATSLTNDRAPVAYTTSWVNTVTYRITPSADLAPSSVHTVSISVSAESNAGEAISVGWSTSFTTIAAPTILSSDPSNDDEQVDLYPEISLSFSEAMDHDSVEGALSFTNAGAAITYHSAWLGNNLRIEAEEMLPLNTVHTIAIGTGAMSQRGVHLEAIWTLDFTTQTLWPVVMSTFPENDATDVALNPVLNIEFSRDMETTITEAAISIDPAVGMTFEWQDSTETAVISLSASLAPSTLYTVTVAQSAQAVNTETLLADHEFSFTTGISLDTTAPEIVSWTPVDGSTGVPNDIGTISVTFSEAVDPESVNPTSMDARLVSAMNYGDPIFSADYTEVTLELGNLPPGTTIFLDLGPFSDRAGNVSTDPDRWEITIAGTIDWFPAGAGDNWGWFEVETDEEGNPLSEPYLTNARVDSIDGNDFRIDSYSEHNREEVLEESEYYTKGADWLRLRGFGNLEYEEPGQPGSWVEEIFSTPLDWLMLPPVAHQSWVGTSSLIEGLDTMTVNYTVDVGVFEDLVHEPPGGEGGPEEMILPGCAPVKLSHEITLPHSTIPDSTIVIEEGFESLWYCPGVGLVRSLSEETDYDEEGENPEQSWYSEDLMFWSIGQ
jgi:hypothetical protein